MRIFLIFFLLFSTRNLLANEFEEELQYLEQEAEQIDEVTLSNAAIAKDEIKLEKKEEVQEDNQAENLFFKSQEIKPRRIRSR